jgi:hypothetical protein
VDEMFIAVKTCSDENTGTKSYNFISLKTFQVERSLSSRAKCLKETDAVPSHFLLTTIELECEKVAMMMMNETRLVCVSGFGDKRKMHVIDLQPIQPS